jgi:predicted metal-dependent hydrolase
VVWGTSNEKFLDIDGRRLPIVLRRNPRAKQLILRVESGRTSDDPDKIAVTLPRFVSDREALAFVDSKQGWILGRVANLPERVAITQGTALPFLGEELLIVHDPAARRGVWRIGSEIHVSGKLEFLSRRVTDWIKRQARLEISERVVIKAGHLNKKAGRISIRDTRSRWGSCASNGNLSFSWRLILAPEFVFDYVIAHEVCHLEEHNHGDNFWRLVDELTPEMDTAKAWLRHNGERLHRYG